MRKRQLAWGAIPAVALAGQIERHWVAGPWSRIDFHIYYDAVSSMHSTPLYDFREPGVRLGFTYPPVAAFLLRPLTILSETTAEQAWLVLSALLCAAFAALTIWGIDHGNSRRPFPRSAASLATASIAATLVIASMPVSLTLRLGQINALIAFLLALDAVLLTRRSRFGGVASGLAAAIKVTPLLMIPALLVMRRRADAARAAATVIGLTGIAAVVAPRESWAYFTDAIFDTRRVGRGGDFNGSLRRLVGQLHETDAAWLVAGLALLVLLIAAFGVRRAALRGDFVEAVTITMLCSYVVSPITWGHHVFFVGPAVYLLWMRRDPLSRVLALGGALVLIDPFEGGEGYTYSMWRLAFMMTALVVLAATSPRRVTAPTPATVPATTLVQCAGNGVMPPSVVSPSVVSPSG